MVMMKKKTRFRWASALQEFFKMKTEKVNICGKCYWNYVVWEKYRNYDCKWSGIRTSVDSILINVIVAGPTQQELISSSPFGQNGYHFTDDSFKCIFKNEKFCILIQISLKFVPKGPIESKSELLQVMAWRWTGDKPLPEPMLTQFIDAYILH